MLHTVTIRYDRAIVRHALNRYMARRLGAPFFVVAILLGVWLVWSFAVNHWEPYKSYTAIALCVVGAFLALAYFARLRAAEGFFDKSNDPEVTLHFTADGVETVSDLGTTNLRWSVFEEILKFDTVWLLVYAKSGYMTLPVDRLTPECQQFIDQNVQASVL